MAEEGTCFALDEYQVPRYGKEAGLLGGTMPKAPKDKGGLFHEVQRLAGVGPGPEKYHKDIMEQPFASSSGGNFSKVGREPGKPVIIPSVGQYAVEEALDKTKKRPVGGKINSGDRKSFFTVMSEKNTIPAPGKYETKPLEEKVHSPVFSSPRTVSRVPKLPSPMGPGYYTPGHEAIEKRVLCYGGSKGDAKSFLDKIMNNKNQTPAPGHAGIPYSKSHDKLGQSMHSARLLFDRQIAPRGIDSSRSPR